MDGREALFDPGPVAVPHTGSAVHVSVLHQKNSCIFKKGCHDCGMIVFYGLDQEIPGAARHPVRTGWQTSIPPRDDAFCEPVCQVLHPPSFLQLMIKDLDLKTLIKGGMP